MKAVFRTHKGNIRASNQDAVLFAPQNTLFAVADGMGGHNAGDIASRMTVESVQASLSTADFNDKNIIDAVRKANKEVYERQLSDTSLSGMGTTLALIWAQDSKLLCANIGDSRVYLFRNNMLKRITRDHSIVQEMIESGVLTEEKARISPYRSCITRAIGTDETVETDIFSIDCSAGDRYLICSDGLTEHISEARISEIMKYEQIEIAADAFLNETLAAGGTDNVSFVIAEVSL